MNITPSSAIEHIGQKGQTLIEFGLTISLVAIVSISVLTGLGNSIRDFMNNVDGNAPAGQGGFFSATANNSSNTANLLSNFQGGYNGILPAPTAGQEQVCFNSSYCLNVPVETAGAFGNNASVEEQINNRSALLEQIADQLEEAEPGSSLAELIRLLASEGHSMGDNIHLAHVVLAHIQGNSNTYDPDLDSNSDGFISPIDALIPINGLTGIRNDFTTLHDQIVAEFGNNTSLLPPALQAIVLSEAQDILALSENNNDPNNANVIHLSANNICTTSGDSSCQVQVPGS